MREFEINRDYLNKRDPEKIMCLRIYIPKVEEIAEMTIGAILLKTAAVLLNLPREDPKEFIRLMEHLDEAYETSLKHVHSRTTAHYQAEIKVEGG